MMMVLRFLFKTTGFNFLLIMGLTNVEINGIINFRLTL